MGSFREGGDLGGSRDSTYSLHCSSFLGLPYRILNIYLVKPKKGTTMETTGRVWGLGCEGSAGSKILGLWGLGFQVWL